MELYPVLKFLHVTAAVVWLGGGAALVALGVLLSRRGDADGFMALIGLVALAGPRLFLPASVATLLSGAALVWVGGHGWPAWVVLGLAGIAFTALFGALVLGPSAECAIQSLNRLGPRVAQRDGRRLLRLAKFDYVVQFAIVYLMVAKPDWNQPEVLLALALAVLLGAAAFLLPQRQTLSAR